MGFASAHEALCRTVLAAFALATAVLACLVLFDPSVSSAHGNDSSADPGVVPDELVVVFDDGVSFTEQKRVVRRSGGQVEERVESLDGVV